jgi:hypothetical protein
MVLELGYIFHIFDISHNLKRFPSSLVIRRVHLDENANGISKKFEAWVSVEPLSRIQNYNPGACWSQFDWWGGALRRGEE